MYNYSKEYAKAIYSIAQEENKEEIFLEELKFISEVFDENPEYMKLLLNPRIKSEEKHTLIDDLFKGGLNKYIVNFMKILITKYQIDLIPTCCEVYRKIYNKENGIIEVTAVTAVDLSEELRNKLILKLERITGNKILLTNEKDPSCIGGLKIIYEGIKMDSSIKNSLDDLKKSFYML